MSSARLPAAVEVSAFVRQVQAAGGFAAVIHRGHDEAGSILLILTRSGLENRVFERLPDARGGLVWHRIADETIEKQGTLSEYCERRVKQDPDLWIVELDIANGERFIGLTATQP